MKKLFTAIRHGDIELVKQVLSAKPTLVNCTAKQPPKKDDGQSPLQVALKTGQFDIAELLLDMGADVNFMEDPSCCNQWRTPVIHDAITAAVMNTRYSSDSEYFGIRVFSTKEKRERACQILERILRMGANVNDLDSYGNSGLWRFCMQAAQVLPAHNYIEDTEVGSFLFTDEVREDMLRILYLLAQYGADTSLPRNGQRGDTATVMTAYPKGALASLLRTVFPKDVN